MIVISGFLQSLILVSLQSVQRKSPKRNVNSLFRGKPHQDQRPFNVQGLTRDVLAGLTETVDVFAFSNTYRP